MGQEWNWQIDELKNQEAYNASRIEDAIRSQTEAINRANDTHSSVGSSGPIFSPKTRRKIIIGVLLFFFCFGILGNIVCFIAYFILDALGKI